MTQNKQNNKKNNTPISMWLFVCLILAILSVFPYILLGQDSIITYHDQLDGELITYLLNAKYLFSNITTYPELMNGISRASLVSPAPGFIVFFRLFNPFVAFIICLFTKNVISIVFMFLVLYELGINNIPSMFYSLLFMLLPFYTVYGLCIPGISVIIYSLLKLQNNPKHIRYYVLIFIYALFSSLSLVGFAGITILFFIYVLKLFTRKKSNIYLYALSTLIFGYTITNINLIKQLIFPDSSFISHKSEVIKSGRPLFQSLKYYFWDGIGYTLSFQKYYLLIILVGFLCALYVLRFRQDSETFYKSIQLTRIITLIIVLGLAYSFFNCPWYANYANAHGGIIHDFNFDRFCWIAPPLWIISFALSVDILIQEVQISLSSKIATYICKVICIFACLITLYSAFMANDVSSNVKKMIRHNNYDMMTWKQFFAEDLFSEVDSIIGKDKKTYRTVSYGIYPAAATYNGFYCLDAYSNNYDVNYKHKFSKILEPVFENDDYLNSWFNHWGNRCYLVQPTTGTYFTYEKKWTPYIDSININLDELRDLNCHYLISAIYIINSEECGLYLLNVNDEPIQTEESWYRLWVYYF